MIKNLYRRKLSRPSTARRALLRSLATALFKNEKIKTTYPKAKEVAWFAEKLITKAKKNTLASRREIYAEIQDKNVRYKLYEAILPRYESKKGGYTTIHRMGFRKSDSAEMALISLN